MLPARDELDLYERTTFVGADDPLVTGAQLNFRPITWGFTSANLQFDGQSVQANVRMLREGTSRGARAFPLYPTRWVWFVMRRR